MNQKIADSLRNKKISPIEAASAPRQVVILNEIVPAPTIEQLKILSPAFAAAQATFRPANAPVKMPHCPLCRRRNTVTLQNQESAGHGKVVSEFSCSYSGCRGYVWKQ